MNRVLIIGNVESISDLKTYQNRQFCTLIVKTSADHVNKNAEWHHKEKFHTVTVWGRGAVNCTTYLQLNRLIYIDGVLDGPNHLNDQKSASVYCNRVEFLGNNDGKRYEMIPAIINGPNGAEENPNLASFDIA